MTLFPSRRFVTSWHLLLSWTLTYSLPWRKSMAAHYQSGSQHGYKQGKLNIPGILLHESEPPAEL